MLNAKAKSKAKLPICAMRENPNSFFQKLTGQATVRSKKTSHGRTKAKWTRRSVSKRVSSETLNRLCLETFPPGSGRGSAARRRMDAPLCAVLVVALANFPFGSEPVFGFVARLESAALSHQVGQAADFFFYIDRYDSGARVGLDDLRLGRCFPANRFLDAIAGSAIAVRFGHEDFARSGTDRRCDRVLAGLFGDSRFCHIAYSLNSWLGMNWVGAEEAT